MKIIKLYICVSNTFNTVSGLNHLLTLGFTLKKNICLCSSTDPLPEEPEEQTVKHSEFSR